jgi:carboxypeptidase D
MVSSHFPLTLPQLFFWFFPPGPQGSTDDLILWYVFIVLPTFVWTQTKLSVYQVERRSRLLFTVWLAQREWCKFSSAVIQSATPDRPDTSQPFLWPTGNAFPQQNEWSWTNLSSVLYVEQPVGTGFSQGLPNAKVCILPSFRVAGLQQFVVYIVALLG